MDDKTTPGEAMTHLRQCRHERGDSLQAAAIKLQVDKSTVSKIENGRFKPGRDLSLRIWKVYGISPWAWDGAEPTAQDVADLAEVVGGTHG